MNTPVEILALENPACKEIIGELSKKWAKRTKKLATKWPVEGTFDVAMCKEMEVLTKNHKTSDKSEKRNNKREQELGVLKLFKKYGIKLLKLERENTKTEERPPPYAPCCDQVVNQMPLVQGKIDIKGPIEFEGYVDEANSQEEIDQNSCIGPLSLEGREEGCAHRAAEERLERQEEGRRTPAPLSQPRRERERTTYREEPRVGATRDYKEKRRSGEPLTHRHLSAMLEELEECHKQVMSSGGGRKSYEEEEPDEPSEGRAPSADSIQKELDEIEARCNRTEEKLKQAINVTRQESDQTVRSLQPDLDELLHLQPAQPHSSLHHPVHQKQYKQVAGTLIMQDIAPPSDQHQEYGQRDEEEYRSTRTTRSKTRVTREAEDDDAKYECPILIKQGHAQYIPWAGQDLDSLVSRLPDIHEGAGKWIRTVEEETTGKLLALGDIKALLAKCLGASKMNDILKQSGLLHAVDRPEADGISFDKHRHDIWRVLRAEYPMQTDPSCLKGEPMGEAENPTTYIQKQLRRWKEELERDPEQDRVLTALFRTAIVEAMPAPVKLKLEDVVGLNSKSHKEFRDHVVHAVEQYRKQELKMKNQEKELQRKLTQMQLEELLNKKKKIQAVQKEDTSAVMAPVNTSVPVNPPAPMNMTAPANQIVTAQAPPAGPSNIPQGQPPVVIYLKPEQANNRNWNRPQQGGRGRGRFNNNQQKPGICWRCNQPGHFKKDCPSSPWLHNQLMTPGANYGQQPMQTQVQGPVNPWRGPDEGY
jgi:hypothetical protein